MISILGAGGYLGSVLTNYFNSLSIPVVTISRSYQWTIGDLQKRIHANVSETQKYLSHIESSSSIIYMAGSTNILKAEENSADDLISHLNELDSFLKSIKYQKNKPKTLILLSSAGAVYGDSLGKTMSEQDKLSPKSIYGKRNLLLEDVFSSYCDSLGVIYTCLRVSNPYGLAQKNFRRKGLIHSLIESEARSNIVQLRGNGNQKRDYILDKDFSRIVCSLMQLKELPRVINICSGRSLSAIELVNILTNNGFNPSFSINKQQPDYEVYDSILSNKLMISLLKKQYSCELTNVETVIKDWRDKLFI